MFAIVSSLFLEGLLCAKVLCLSSVAAAAASTGWLARELMTSLQHYAIPGFGALFKYTRATGDVVMVVLVVASIPAV